MRRLGVSLDEVALGRFERYLGLLEEHGGRFNLTGVRDEEGVQRRHFVESLAVGVALEQVQLLQPGSAVIDVGSGAGFPGIPLAIAWPELQVTVLEATRKKADFLAIVLRELGLDGAVVVNARAEEAAHRDGMRERFDLALARAVAPLATLAELTLPFVAVGGSVAAIKGSRLDAELPAARAAIRACGGGTPRELRPAIQDTGHPPRLLLVPKRRATPPALPRAPGLPARSPLR